MITSSVILILTAYLICSIFNVGLYFFITSFGLIILQLEILSLFKSINVPAIIIINLVFFFAALFFLRKLKKPLYKPQIKNSVKKIFNSLKLDKGLLILSLCFIFLAVVSFFLAAFIPVNEPDAQGYHVFRAFIWAKDGFIHHFITPDVRNSVMPVNSEIVYTWIITFTKSDTGLGLLQFFAWIFSCFTISAILKEYKFSTRQTLWVIYIYSSLAGIIAQISSTQTDLLTGALILFGIWAYIKYTKTNSFHFLYFSTLSAALSMGTKSTGVIAALGLFTLICVLNYKNYKKIVLYALLLFANFTIFSSYNYILNFIEYSNPLGSVAAIEQHGFWGTPKTVLANFIRYLFQMFDFTGFTWGYFLNTPILSIQNGIFSILNIDPQTGVNIEMESLNSFLSEQTMGYGILGFLIFVPSCLLIMFKKNYPKLLRMLGALFFINLLLMSASIAYMVFSIRFIACFVAISSPVLVISYFKKNNPLKFLTVMFTIYYMTLVSTHLAQRPFYKLMNSYKKESSYESFKDNVRCLNYDYFTSKGGSGCDVRDYLNTRYKSYNNIALFPDYGTIALPLYVNNNEKNIDIFLLSRFDEYNLDKYNLVVISYPAQKIGNFNKNEKYSKKCMYYTKNDRQAYEIKNNVYKYASFAQCKISYDDLNKKGFKPDTLVQIKKDEISKTVTYAFWIRK